MPIDAVQRLARRLANLVKAGQPPSAILTDRQAAAPLWSVVASAVLPLTAVLGDEPRVLPNLWVHWVDGGKQGRRRGWLPHTDQAAQTVFGSPTLPIIASLSAWVPLTPATPHNGAMRIIRRTNARCSAGCTPGNRALTLAAQPGDLIGWRQDLTHWGGRYDPIRALGPRAALAIEVQSRNFAPYDSPLIDPTNPPLPSRFKPLADRTKRRYRAFDRAAD